MKKAFSLIELLVVIGILGVLMSVLVAYTVGGFGSARAAKCLTNMGNLARAVQQYGSSMGFYPVAGSIERLGFDESQGVRNVKERYSELPGWISWNSAGQYKSHPQSHIAGAGWFTSAYDEDLRAREYCLTNGALWKYMSGSATCYTCPDHVIKMENLHKTVGWSYVMNGYFRYDESQGGSSRSIRYTGIEYNTLSRADRRLLFAELQWENYAGVTPDFSPSAGFENDCTLQYKDSAGGEMIGFNHKSGREKVAHVVFADGHTDKISLPKRGMSTSQIKELTKWLCEGKDVAFDGKAYREMQ